MSNTWPSRSYPDRAWPGLAWPLYGTYVPPVTAGPPGVIYGDWRREVFEQLLTEPGKVHTVNTGMGKVGGVRTGPDKVGVDGLRTRKG
jgi:hypothetical protein